MELKPIQNHKIAYQLFHDGVQALARAERAGMRIDMDYCNRVNGELETQIRELETAFFNTKFFRRWQHSSKSKVNIDSGTQLGYYLYKVLKLTPPTTTESGKGSADEESLNLLEIPELNDLLKIRKLKKAKSTYLEAFMREQVNGWIHPSFNLHLVTTFRSSSDSPNFQNLPKRDKEIMKLVRSAIFPRPGHQLMEIDTSGMEFRIAGCYYQDPTMLKYIQDPNSDIHGDIAKRVYMIENWDKKKYGHFRSAAKNGFVFTELYGSWYKQCAINLSGQWGELIVSNTWKKGQGVKFNENRTIADHFLENDINNLAKFQTHVKTVEDYLWNDVFKTGKRFQDRLWKSYQKNGYIDTFTGFRFSGLMSLNNVLNYPIQGAAFHCLLWAFIETDKLCRTEKLRTRLVGQIHDSLVLDVHPDEVNYIVYSVKKIFSEKLREAWQWIIVPIEVEVDLAPIDGSWAEMKEFKD